MNTTLTNSGVQTQPVSRSPMREALVAFGRNHAALLGVVLLLTMVGMSIIGPWLYPVDPFDIVWAPLSPPGTEGFVLGTDYLGRDIVAGIV